MKTLGKFEILGRIGQGAMGVVYKARDPLIGRLVALKTITTGLAEDPASLDRFYREARSAGALQHPNIVTIYELGEEDNTPFIAMEYLSGESLNNSIQDRHALALSQKVGYVAYLCRALAYAHKQGVVHRDVKPANIMITSEGTVKVVDFGIASITENSKSLSGVIVGTLGYMSPQQLEGRRADARSDIWAAGIVFYELMAYRRPFEGENYGALVMNIMTQEMPPLSEIAPETPPDAAAVVDRMLQKDIDKRFQSMEEALIELEPVWRRLQRSEVSDLLSASRELLKAGSLGKAHETVRRVLQIDTASSPAKDLLEQINAEIRRNPTVSLAETNLQDDETLTISAKDAIRPPLSALPRSTASRSQSVSVQSRHASGSVNRMGAVATQRAADVQSELPAGTSAHPEGLKWKKPILIGLLALGITITAAGSYFLLFQRPNPSPPGTSVLTGPPASSAVSNSEPSVSPPPVKEQPAGTAASAGLENQERATGGNSSGTKSPVRDSGSKIDTDSPARVTRVPEPQTQVNEEAVQKASLPSSNRTDGAVNSSAALLANERSSLPVASNPQPAAPTSQPPVVTAPSPATETLAPVPTGKAVESPSVVTSPEKPSPDNLDHQAITVSLQQLSVAFSDRSLAELEEIWPKLGPNRSTFKKVFDGAKSLSREFHMQSLNISNDGDTATAVGTYEGKIRDGRGVETPNSGNFYVRFVKKNGRWYIDDASF